MVNNPMTHNVRILLGRAQRLSGEFFRLESSGGILLILMAGLALISANSFLEPIYSQFREAILVVSIGDFGISKPFELWINDGLMAIFFLLVALEIKREMLSGQLSSFDQILLPVLCAAAGVLVPALIYWGMNYHDAVARSGWAVPTATDIAFALGVLSLFGKRVPPGMKLLLSTIAVVDDLVAIVIIGVFFSGALSVPSLLFAGGVIAIMLLLNRRGVTQLTPYILLGVVLWICVLKSGVHATLAGVVTGMMIPHRKKSSENQTLEHVLEYSPLEILEQALHPWVAYAILPLFAFINAGLALGGFNFETALGRIPLGVAVGLLIGKPIGIIGAALIARMTGIARFPEGMDFKMIFGLGLLCGIGFTMSLFIGSLAFIENIKLSEASVLGVLSGSFLSAIIGYAWLHFVLPKRPFEKKSGV